MTRKFFGTDGVRGQANSWPMTAEVALKLGAAGYPEYYGLAERYLRGMLLPTQHREAELRAFMHDNDKPKGDAEFDVIRRTAGGHAMQLPNDRMREGDWPLSTLDITSGAIHAMAECYRSRVTRDGSTAQVNLFFDFEDDGVAIASALPLEGRITFHAKSIDTLRVRAPAWVARDDMEVTVDGERVRVVFQNGYVVVDNLAPGTRGEVRFPLTCKVEREIVDSTTYTTAWIGEQLVCIQPRGAVSPLPF